ncbi:hypothetical protein ACM66B_000600 [Microbotryomycetes sp. NB124-2]
MLSGLNRLRSPTWLALLVSTLSSLSALGYVVYLGVSYERWAQADVAAICLNGVAWAAYASTCLISLYAQSLPPSGTWMWDAPKRVIALRGRSRPAASSRTLGFFTSSPSTTHYLGTIILVARKQGLK